MTRPSDSELLARHHERARKRYEEKGDKGVILQHLNWCLSVGVPPPKWLLAAFDAACRKIKFFEVGSCDDVFGRVVPKGKSPPVWEKHVKTPWDAYVLVRQLHESDPKKYPLSRGTRNKEGAFAAAAKKLPLSAREVEDTYYKMKDLLTEAPGSPDNVEFYKTADGKVYIKILD